MLILLLCFYMLVAHWLACIWYSIGRSDTENGIVYSWLHKLANTTQTPFMMMTNFTEWEFERGPPRRTMYVTALYFTMTCMTSVGFGNVAAETDNEKVCQLNQFGQLKVMRLMNEPLHMSMLIVAGFHNLHDDNRR